LRPTLFVIASCAWGAALFALPTTLEVALEIHVSLFGDPREVPAACFLATHRDVLTRVVGDLRGLSRAAYVRRDAPLAYVGSARSRGGIGLRGDLQGTDLHLGVLHARLLRADRGSPRAVLFGVSSSGIAMRAAHRTSTLLTMSQWRYRGSFLWPGPCARVVRLLRRSPSGEGSCGGADVFRAFFAGTASPEYPGSSR
jgi:hypothetical protein